MIIAEPEALMTLGVVALRRFCTADDVNPLEELASLAKGTPSP